MEYHKGDVIIRKGDAGNTFYMIKSGEVVCSGMMSAGKPVADLHLHPGDYFGERALLMEVPRAADVKAVSADVRGACKVGTVFEVFIIGSHVVGCVYGN